MRSARALGSLALVALALAATGCAKERGAIVGTTADSMSIIAGELLHAQLAARPEGARRSRCGDAIDCLSKLRAGAVDVLVIERGDLESLAPGDPAIELVAELPVSRRFVLAGRAGATLASLAALGRPPRVAVSAEFASRPTAGVDALDRIAGGELVVAGDEQRAAWVAAGAVDAAVFERHQAPPGLDVLAPIDGGRYVVVAARASLAHNRAAVATAAGAVAVRLEKLGERMLAAVGSGLDPLEAVETMAPRDRAPAPPLVVALAPRHRGWAPLLTRGLARRTATITERADPGSAIAGGAATLALVSPGVDIAGAEQIAVYSGGGRPDAVLWARVESLELADARAVIAASPRARMPRGDRPSLWRRQVAASTTAPRRGASRWFDTLINLLVGVFLGWLLLSIVRRD